MMNPTLHRLSNQNERQEHEETCSGFLIAEQLNNRQPTSSYLGTFATGLPSAVAFDPPFNFFFCWPPFLLAIADLEE